MVIVFCPLIVCVTIILHSTEVSQRDSSVIAAFVVQLIATIWIFDTLVVVIKERPVSHYHAVILLRTENSSTVLRI